MPKKLVRNGVSRLTKANYTGATRSNLALCPAVLSITRFVSALAVFQSPPPQTCVPWQAAGVALKSLD